MAFSICGRLSLGHKQLEENPWDSFESKFTVGSIHQGTVIEVLDKGAVISLEDGVESFAVFSFIVMSVFPVEGALAASICKITKFF